VQIQVEGDDNIKNELSSYLKREFRGLHDVDIVESKPALMVHAFAMTQMSADKRPWIVVVSVAISRPIDHDWFRTLLPTVNEKQLNDLDRYTKDSVIPAGQLLHIGEIKDVDAISKAIVTEVDTSCIEPDRKFDQEIRDLEKKTNEKSK